jgi:hypothetical protein
MHYIYTNPNALSSIYFNNTVYIILLFLLNNSMALVRKQSIPTEWLRLSAKLVPTFADTVCRMVSATDPYGRIFGVLYWSRYSFFQVAPHLYSRCWVDPVPDPLLLRKSGSARNQTWSSETVARNSDHQTTKVVAISLYTDKYQVNCIHSILRS